MNKRPIKYILAGALAIVVIGIFTVCVLHFVHFSSGDVEASKNPAIETVDASASASGTPNKEESTASSNNEGDSSDDASCSPPTLVSSEKEVFAMEAMRLYYAQNQEASFSESEKSAVARVDGKCASVIGMAKSPVAPEFLYLITEYEPGDDIRDCAACSAPVHAIVIKKEAEKWVMVDKKADFSSGGGWGNPPGVSLFKLSKDNTVLKLIANSATQQGEGGSSMELVGIVEHLATSLLSLSSDDWSRYSGEGENGEATGENFSSKIELAGTASLWPDLKVTKTLDEKNEMISTYIFKDGKYILKAPAAH